ncbi:MAG: hypothetical protein JXB48_14035 [Candidatus Latescibacteria bacterium]|nr:hypothetical protein [Candidatus Latescibacterota bacterium]
MFGSQSDLRLNPVATFPKSYEWDSITLDSDGNISHSSYETFNDFGDKLIDVDKSPMVIGYLIVAFFHFFIGLVAGGLFFWLIN